MRVKIDKDLCTGHGRCEVTAGAYYQLDSNGYNAERGKTLQVPPEMEALARKGAKFCPERAITIIEGE
jgi:ferredoxin